jgi:aminoglycoside 3-N-acetyltransferase
MPGLKRIIMNSLPAPAVSGLRAVRRAPRRTRYRFRQRVDPAGIAQRGIEAALRDAGVGTGDTVFFQASMSAFGIVRGGPGTVIGSLEAVVGPSGTIAMPAFPIVGRAVDHLSSGQPFDVRTSPATTGAISERFRCRTGVVRSLHPTHSVAVSGPNAAELVAGHADAATPFGTDTPFARLIERDALQVWFGCGVGPFTIYHAFECLREDGFPIPVFLSQRFRVACTDLDGTTREVTTLVHDPEVSKERIDNTPAIAERMRAELMAGGQMRRVALGDGEILAVRLQSLMGELERLLGRGMTIYPARALADA